MATWGLFGKVTTIVLSMILGAGRRCLNSKSSGVSTELGVQTKRDANDEEERQDEEDQK
jgi:hypothetical protein